jgi:cobalamin biosynthesis protein CobD/CbiB
MGNATISFNPDDPEDCKRAVTEMRRILWGHLGPAQVRRLFSEATPSRRVIGVNSNVDLMATYVAFRKVSKISVEKFAAYCAKVNETLSRDDRVGPRGSTNREALEKQIRREKKRAAKHPVYRELIESVAEKYQERVREALRAQSK